MVRRDESSLLVGDASHPSLPTLDCKISTGGVMNVSMFEGSVDEIDMEDISIQFPIEIEVRSYC